jgi:putative aminopeptidase FrvX
MKDFLSAAALDETLCGVSFLTDEPRLPAALERLLRANAPSGGAALPGAIGDVIRALVDELGLSSGFVGEIGSTGNLGLVIGADKPVNDLIVFAHMDRPSFKVRDAAAGELYPVCANRFPDGVYHAAMKAMRFEDGQLVVSARGILTSVREGGKDTLTFTAGEGDLRWYDILTVDAEPQFKDGWVHGTGLDNCLGVIAALGAAAALKQHEGALKAANRRLLITFTDHEEGNPEAFFGHGAARLAYAVPPPTFGVIDSDAHSPNANGAPAMGGGASHGSVSAWGRGSFVPPNYMRLALDRAEQVNALRPGTVQFNTGYMSRSDDLPAFRWTKVLGMIGAPMTGAHTAEESAQVADVRATACWLAQYVAAVLAQAA